MRSFIEQHGESRFTPKQTGYSSQVRQRAGWLGRSCASMRSRHTVYPEHNTDPQTLYLFIQLAGVKPPKAAGYLVPDGNRPQRKVSLPDNTRPRMYCVKGSILDD